MAFLLKKSKRGQNTAATLYYNNPTVRDGARIEYKLMGVMVYF